MTREKLKLKATENKNPEVPEEVRKGTRVNMDQHLHLDDPWEERRDVGTHLGQSRNQAYSSCQQKDIYFIYPI